MTATFFLNATKCDMDRTLWRTPSFFIVIVAVIKDVWELNGLFNLHGVPNLLL